MDPTELLAHWGYLAVFLVVVLGNMGLPVPEETILGLAGYLVWRGELRLPLVLLVGILSAVLGDNLGYWIGRRYGRPVLERCGDWLLLGPRRLETGQRLVSRYGVLAVFGARFVPGLRFLAGPVAGVVGLRPVPFMAANSLGAICYVPLVVALGYLLGYGLADRIVRVERMVGRVERLTLVAAAGLSLGFLGWRVARRLGGAGGRTRGSRPGAERFHPGGRGGGS